MSSSIPVSAGRAETLLELLRYRAQAQPEAVAFRFLLDGETATAELGYSALHQRAGAIAAFLQQRGCSGARVLVVDDSAPEFITGFFGCLYAGALPVPVAPARRRDARRLHSIAECCRPAFVLSCGIGGARLAPERRAAVLETAEWINVRDVPDDAVSAWRPPAIASSDTAFLQFTSGSTARPRGVVLSHANLLHNQELMRRAFNTGAHSIVVGWLPLHHDMGLIGTVLHPLFLGVSCVLMSPGHFMERPMRWLRAVSNYRATISGGPNFAFDLCARRATAAECASLDLSCWQVAFNGAEPVRPETMRRFSLKFATAGFRREAFHPCYGLAEATLFVAGSACRAGAVSAEFNRATLKTAGALAATGISDVTVDPSADVRGQRELIAYAPSTFDQELVIVRPEEKAVGAPGEVGEIWIAGPSVAAGYWNDPEETQRVFGERLPGRAGRFLRTGDLGYLDGQRLFITGRLKDLLIIRGRNIHPEDIEQTVAASHLALRGGSCVAFARVEDGEDRLVVVHELLRAKRPRSCEQIAAAARLAVTEAHDVHLHTLVFVKAGRLPRTTSGKPQRQLCRTLFLDGVLDALYIASFGQSGVEPRSQAESAAIPEEPVGKQHEAILKEEVGRLLGIDQANVDLEGALGALGVDSLMSVELQHRLEQRLGIELSADIMLATPSLSALAGEIAVQLATQSARSRRAIRVEPGGPFPLSRGQHALWFLDRIERTRPVAVLTRAVRIRGRLHVEAFQRALQALVQRHEALRTILDASAGEPVQLVRCDGTMCALVVEDASEWTGDQLQERVQEFADRPLDVAGGALVRAALYRRSDLDQVFALTVHHCIADFWSLAVMLRDLEELYAAERDGRMDRLPSVGATYRDYVQREQDLLKGPEEEHLLAFWKDELDGAPLTLDLAADHPRPPVQSFKGATFPVTLERSLTAAVRAFAAARGATLFSVLAAAFQTLLHRYTGQAELLLGTPVAVRPARWRHSVGYCVNLLPLRASFFAHSTFDAVVDEARTRIRSAMRHQDLPFSAMVERVRPVRDPSRHPMVQSTFMLLTDRIFDRPGLAGCAAGVEGARLGFADLSMTVFPIEHGSGQFDLSLTLGETGDRLSGRFEYNTDLFEPATVRRLSDHWLVLLGHLVSQPAIPVGDLPLLTPDERRHIVECATVTTRPLPGQAVHQLFEAQVLHTPAAQLADEQSTNTHRELNLRANQWARVLRRRGVATETRVAICTSRSIHMLLGALAILKAGGAYVPLDPTHPRRRLGDVLEDCAAPILVADRAALAMLPGFPHEIVDLDDDAPARVEETGNLDLPVHPEQAAYVLYTSGSTGSPNGVVVSHASLANLLLSMQRQPGLGPRDRLLSITTFAFDIAGLELFLPLIAGASVVIAGEETIRDSARLQQHIEEWHVTMMQATPATWRMLLDGGWRGKSDLTALCGGEALTPDLAARLVPRCAALWNMYGPTETTIWSTTARLADGDGPISIGRPIDNTEVHLLDARLQPVPAGVAGEIFIGGIGLARGYLARPELTADRFIPHPLTSTPGARLYRTGDRGRYRPDGSIEFLGRIDDQIKLRGFRIELPEIERALAEHAGVRHAAAALRPDARGEMSLVGYVVLEDTAQGAVEVDRLLRKHLGTILPAYLVPASIVVLRQLPLTSTGKVDRRRLPSVPALPTGAARGRPPTSRERAIREVWREVLKIDGVGLDDNFFDLGGHSLLLNQVRTRIAAAFGRDVPLIEFFSYTTVRTLAQYLDRAGEVIDAIDPFGVDAADQRHAAEPRRQELRRRRLTAASMIARQTS
jgi:amino acid adenylation domain-containing protein